MQAVMVDNQRTLGIQLCSSEASVYK